jgi:UDP-GlcNAc:undecaprenyl-phosphate/decaprenyl-phosphate GlcNAc-1-phosphate transferase
MAFLILVFFTSFVVVLVSTPSLIKVAILKRLFDAPSEERKIHSGMIPTIGGIIIFAATIFSYSLWFPSEKIHDSILLFKALSDYKYIVATMLLMFFIGVKDDIIGTAPVKKLIAQLIAVFIMVLMADIRITSLHGILGIFDIPHWASIFLSMFTYVVIINAFNLIDGVDGLASGVGLIASLSFGGYFAFAGDFAMACFALSLAGSLLGFLYFNFSPAKIFMGDSGSLTIGLAIATLAIKLISYDVNNITNEFVLSISKPILAMAVLSYPLLDTLRIFLYRSARGVSPFSADKNHIHHRLMDLFNSHRKTVITIYAANILVIVLSVVLTGYNPNLMLVIVSTVVVLLSFVPYIVKKTKQQKQ